MDFRNIQILVGQDNKEKIDHFIQPISGSNALYFSKFSDRDDYRKTFNLTEIQSGITFQDGQFYYFEHSILDTPKTYHKSGGAYAYFVYPIDEYLKNRIISGESNHWEILLYSGYKYQKKYLIVGNINSKFADQYIIRCHLKDSGLYYPYGNLPADILDTRTKCLKKNITIGEFLNKHIIEYPNSRINLTINKENLRDLALSKIIE